MIYYLIHLFNRSKLIVDRGFDVNIHTKFTPGIWCILPHIVGSGSSRLGYHLLEYEEVEAYLLGIP